MKSELPSFLLIRHKRSEKPFYEFLPSDTNIASTIDAECIELLAIHNELYKLGVYLYCDEEGMLPHKSHLFMNTLANPFIPSHNLISYAVNGGPLGDIVMYREKNKPLPKQLLLDLCKKFDDKEYSDDESNDKSETYLKFMQQAISAWEENNNKK